MTGPLNNITPRVPISVAGMSGTQVTIIRSDPAGNRVPVRSANPATLVGGAWVGYDYEAPFLVPVMYTATSDSGASETAGPTMLNVAKPWLIHPGVPDLSRPVTIRTPRGDRTRPASGAMFEIGQRSTPIVVSDGVRKSAAFDLAVRTATRTEYDAMVALLADMTPLLLQEAYPETGFTAYQYVTVGDATEHKVTNSPADVWTQWTLPCRVVDPPEGMLRPQWTWRDVIANYSTWREVLAAYPTWRDLITNNPRI